METEKIELPESEYVLEINPTMTTGIVRGFQRLIMEKADIDLGQLQTLSPTELKLNINVIYDAQDFVLKNIIVALRNNKGKEIENAFEEINNLPPQDGQIIYRRVDELMGSMSLSPTQKKTGKKPV